MRKLIIFAMALTSLVFLVDAASARVIVLKGTYTQAQVDIACTREGGGSTAGRGHGGFGCKMSEGEVECNAAGGCIGKCQHCGTGEIRNIRGILRPSHDHKTPRAEKGRELFDGQCRHGAAPLYRLFAGCMFAGCMPEDEPVPRKVRPSYPPARKWNRSVQSAAAFAGT
jgi:hypothetical protein